MHYTLNIKGQLLDLSTPRVMGILNATPDSFYAGSRQQTERDIARRANDIIEQGGSIIDVGGYSTRPGADVVSQEEEMARLRTALTIVRREQPLAVVSVDTFRPDVARMCVEELGADIVNDVKAPAAPSHPASPASLQPSPMFRMVARLHVPYILMSAQPDLHQMLLGFAREVQALRDLGQKDIIIDPGFGFGKTLDENYQLMARLERLQVMELPVLVGISRKSMICKRLGTTPEEALNGTTALNTVALLKGASILRVHDVRQAAECVRLMESLKAAPSRNPGIQE